MPRRPEELKLGPLQFTPPKIERVQLSNGIPVYLFLDHDFPICDLSIDFPMGTRYLTVPELAAGRVLSAAWRSGGTESLPPDTLDARLASLDASISSDIESRNGGVTVSLATQDLQKVLPLWRDIVLHPRLDPDRVEKAKGDVVKDLQGINNDPEAIASERMDRLMQGKDYPISHYLTEAECRAVKPEDVRALHQRFVQKKGAVIGVAGDFDRQAVLGLLEKLFHDWPAAAAPAMQPWTAHPEPGVYLLPGDFEQSQIRIGRIVRGLTWDSPSYPAASILSFAFGYGRVFYQARASGLSYGATVMLNVGPEFTSVHGFGSCRTNVTVKLIRSMLAEMDRIKAEPLTAQEMETSRTFEIGNVVRGFESPAEMVEEKVDQVVSGQPDQLKYLDGLRTAPLADANLLINKCAASRDSMVVLVVGNPKNFDLPLDSLGLGPVKELEAVEFGK